MTMEFGIRGTLVVLLGTLVSLASHPAEARQCAHASALEEAISLEGVEQVFIDAVAGELLVSAHDSDEMLALGEACTDKEEWLSGMRFEVSREDGELTLAAVIPSTNKNYRPRYAMIHVDVRLPPDIPLRVRDSSGSARITGVALTQVRDSSGQLTVVDTVADLDVRDSSGDIELRGIRGSLVIVDSSGSMEIEAIDGSVNVRNDSSGNIDIRDVSEAVVIGNDGSGDIEIETVRADVSIGNDGSGSIRISNVNGSVTIDSDGSGGVRIADVGGDFRIGGKGSGQIKTERVEGQIFTGRQW